MQSADISLWMHEHVFDQTNPLAERSTRLVMWITAELAPV
jgi:hypothetical protein